MNSDIAIVIQGPSDNVKEQKISWGNFKDNIIFSTWVGYEDLYNNDDIVIFNEYPKINGPMNINYQIKSTLEGLKKAKELGYKRALKIRSDMIPTNSYDFLKILKPNFINFLCWHNHEVYQNCPGYLVDYLMEGEIDDMITLWSINEIFGVVPEIIITSNLINNFDSDKLNFFIDDINEKNNLYWIKRNIYLDTYKIDIEDTHKKYSFSKTKDYINKDYLSLIKI